MLRSTAAEDLSSSKFVSLTAIRKECSRLVRFIQAEDCDEDGTLELNHSAVFAFLRENADMEEQERERIVSPNLICDLCVRYLAQPRYSQLLTRKSPSEFTTWFGESISTHQLLLYAAKYWYRHCDERATCPESCERLREFLLSPNFRTLLQVQSISIIGHFLLGFDRITGNPRCMKKILPDCAKDINDVTAQILPQFNDFLYEWSELLQLGLTSEFNGEIDRCFWNALGPTHFLHNCTERYYSFHLISQEAEAELGEADRNFCFLHDLSPDGGGLIICRVRIIQ